MRTVSLEEVAKDPAGVLASILSFVWRNDWEWEGHGGRHPVQDQPPLVGWEKTAEDLVAKRGGPLERLLERTSLVIDETSSTADRSSAFVKSVQGAFASEMRRSSNLSAWPCPSFWEGLDGSGGYLADEEDVLALQQVSFEMVPNCSDDDPFVRCSVKKDKCEVKRDAKCT